MRLATDSSRASTPPAHAVEARGPSARRFVSSTVKDLAVGSTLRFIDRGEQQLKRVPDPWRLYAVAK